MKRIVWIFAAVLGAATSVASGASRETSTPQALAVTPATLAAERGVADLKFVDMFKMPVGPRGLEASDRLRALDGRRVRVVGYMVRAEPVPHGEFLLSPLPVELGDEDESLSDDLPASAVLVRLPAPSESLAVPYLPGLVRATGVLHVGPTPARADGRIASIALTLDATPARALATFAKRRAHAP